MEDMRKVPLRQQSDEITKKSQSHNSSIENLEKMLRNGTQQEMIATQTMGQEMRAQMSKELLFALKLVLHHSKPHQKR